MARVGIVTDSTCDMALDQLDALGIVMVPLRVLFGDETFLDWRELAPEEFYARLKTAERLPTTSQPSPADFAAAYARLAEEGCDEIVSIHLSAALSGTISSATMAAADAPVPVRVVDTRKVSHAIELVLREACVARDAGGDGAAVEARALEVSASMRLYFVLETLEYLVKGGRAGKAQGLAASLLDIKPVLDVNEEGIVAPFKKVRGRKKALAELAAHVAEESKSSPMKLALLHACRPEYAEDLRQALVDAGADVEVVSTGLVGAVIGTYAGPDAVGAAYYPSR